MAFFGASPPVIGAAGDPSHDPEIPSRHVSRWFFWVIFSLLGGFKHFLVSLIYGIILPIDFHIFQRGYCTTNQFWFVNDFPYTLSEENQLNGVWKTGR